MAVGDGINVSGVEVNVLVAVGSVVAQIGGVLVKVLVADAVSVGVAVGVSVSVKVARRGNGLWAYHSHGCSLCWQRVSVCVADG